MERRNFFAIVGSVLAYQPFARTQEHEREEKKKKKKPATTATGAARQCSTCVQYAATSGTTPPSGSCQRYPKNYAGGDPLQSKDWMFPIMLATDVCGEYTWEAQ